MLDRLFDAVFPKRCAGCGSGAWPFCPSCHAGLTALAPPWCLRCGFPSARDVPTCRQCPPSEIDVARSPFLFRGPARRAVHRLKFSGWRAVAEALGEAMATVSPWPADAVTWVPLSRRRLAERGFDQARALALVVGRTTSVQVTALLVRTAATAPQAKRGGPERREAMAGVFRVVGPAPPRVLLVDDVLTTGATSAACARALRAAGAAEVALLTAARAVSAPLPDRYTRPGLTPGSVVARETSSR
ncbi:MAG: double zinc ribbon domain-containing protein [Actinomycetota bacterium]